MSLCPGCMKNYRKHMCNTCTRPSCTRQPDRRTGVIVDECRGYIAPKEPSEKIFRVTRSCTHCGVLLREKHTVITTNQTYLKWSEAP